MLFQCVRSFVFGYLARVTFCTDAHKMLSNEQIKKSFLRKALLMMVDIMKKDHEKAAKSIVWSIESF